MEANKSLKRKYADASNHKSITKCKYKNKEFNNEEFVGNISYLEIEEVKDEWYVDVEKRCVLKKGLFWLEIYPKDENFCITAIFDENKKIVEWYIDISRKLGVENKVPYEDDLFLDVVIVHDGRKHLLDEDELKEAYENNIISKDEFDMAYEIANKMLNIKEKDIERLREFSYKYLEILGN